MKNSDICEIIAVRHGETVANKTGILQGQSDTPLNEIGIMQAHAIAERLKKRHFDLAYTSDLNRAVATAELITANHPQLQLVKTPSLREWNLGDLQGQPYTELRIKYPDILNAFKKDGEVPPIPGGENIEDFQNRIGSFMDEIAKANPGKRILFVSHGGAMQRMLKHTMGKTDIRNICPLSANAGMSVFHYQNKQWRLITWNDTAHLEDIQMHETLTF